ncbi:UNVERIFIED_CONTAM: hypothetical protein PYX00_000824 [Menopon gallinae]|uniref:ABC transporter domain-containing protein n=1 Tax=Menopon gallinae TaxID=328185 RepID=A0AAW2IAL9_9NEOP
MHKVFVVLLKDLLIRRSHWVTTIFEVLLPIGIIVLLNITAFPVLDSPKEVIDDVIDKSCHFTNPDVFTKIIYEPYNNFTKSLMSKAKCLGQFQEIRPGSVDGENVDFKIGVKFTGLDDAVPQTLEYEFYPASNFWNNPYQLWGDPTMEFYHYKSGPLKRLLRLQYAIDESFAQLKNIQTPVLTFESTDILADSPRLYKIFVMAAFFFGFSLMISGVVGRLVQEKSSGAKELMLIMGLKRWHLWAAKFLDCLIFFSLVQAVCAFFLHVPLTPNSTVMKFASPSWTMSYLICASFGVLFFLFFLSCIFSNSTISVFVAQTIWGISLVMFLILSYYESLISRHVWLICCLLPHFCFFTGLSIIMDFDHYQKTVKLWEVLSRYPSYPALGHVVIMAFIDIFLYTFLIWYLEHVMPGKYGIPQPSFFCFKRSYWFPKKSRSGVGFSREKTANNENYEPVPERLVPGISVFNLSKEYKSMSSGAVLAVDNVTIDFYKGEISALLGHNGAGKTTFFSMISGLLCPTSGGIIVGGYNIATDTEKARQSFGLCPQEDMLFEDLNPEQILCFFGVIKGLTKWQATSETNIYLKNLKLNPVRHTKAKELSGGQKRKVSLAIALIGGSKVLLLDEPTSGLDPEIRREIWEILLELRGTRTILLTTHIMEEVDAISDRIAIMDHGKVKCYGTPMYLKSKFGSWYTLSVVVHSEDKTDELINLVKSYVRSGNLKSQNGLTLFFQLPQEEVESFPSLLSALDNLQNSNQVHSYSISFSTFEEVFINLKRTDETDTVINMSQSPYKRLECSDEFKRPELNLIVLYLYQLYALLLKKAAYFFRNIFSFSLFAAVPIVVVILQLLIIPYATNTSPSKEEVSHPVNRTLSYSPDSYRNSMIIYSSPPDNKFSKYFNDYVTGHGYRTRNVKNVHDEIKDIFSVDYHVYGRELLMGAEFDNENKKINIHFNSHAIHVLPVSVHMFYNSFLMSNNTGGSIKTSVNLKYSYREENELKFLTQSHRTEIKCRISDMVDSIGIQTVYYLCGPVRERQFSAKHLQLMTTPVGVYWISHLVFDTATFIGYLAVIFMIYWFSGVEDVFITHTGTIFLSYILWGIGLIIITYLLSTCIRKITVAASISLTLYTIFTLLVYNFVQWNMWPSVLQYLHPSCMLKIGLSNICRLENDSKTADLVLYNLILFICLISIDSRIPSNVTHWLLNAFFRVKYPVMGEKNPAVLQQEEYVRDLTKRKQFTLNSLVVDGIKRWYLNGMKPQPAVRGISFAVNNGECFGLLGVNGAGKTTSFKMLTGEVTRSQGEAYVNGYRLFSCLERSKGLRQVGYCPQYAGFIPTLKGKELLSLFARLRGYRGSYVTREVARLINDLGLTEHEDTLIENYSGGNQRKLSVGLAIIGNTSVVLFDEPTSGVDPVSRRQIWKTLANLRKEEKSVLLTSHSMDECESVCTRLAIMVKGNFQCYGEVTTLKELFGHGYTVQLKINADATPSELDSIKSAMSNQFGSGCKLTDEHLTFLEYHLTNKSLKWEVLFTKLIQMKKEFKKLESFHASATTLEQIFIYFARNQ